MVVLVVSDPAMNKSSSVAIKFKSATKIMKFQTDFDETCEFYYFITSIFSIRVKA